MLQNNHNLARPCPSCGAPLRVHASRISQKLQCPKCLDTIVLDPPAATAPPAEQIAVRETVSPPKSPRPAGPPSSVAAAAYTELLLQHTDLTERYAELVTQYEALVSQHADLATLLDRIGTST